MTVFLVGLAAAVLFYASTRVEARAEVLGSPGKNGLPEARNLMTRAAFMQLGAAMLAFVFVMCIIDLIF